MKLIRRHLGWKLFLSYILIIIVGTVTLGIAAELHAPTALDRHMMSMQTMMGNAMDGMMSDLTINFRQAINEVLLVSASLALATAILVSTYIARRIVQPIQEMQVASQRIADGHYEERVQAVGEDELAELAHAFNQMVDKLEKTEERRRQLIGDVAHELRTPLSSIKSVLEGLQDGVLPTQPETFASLQREVSRLQHLVQDLEELSRADAGQIPLEFSVTNPAGFIQLAVDRLARQFDDKGVQLHLQLSPDLPSVNVDVPRMTQVMLNLLGNAMQYTPSDGQVIVRAWSSDHEVYIAVQDNGVGLAAHDLQHIFERFYRVDKSRARTGGGSGIGLTIARYLVDAHHGQLAATSPGLDQGSTFTITLPIAE